VKTKGVQKNYLEETKRGFKPSSHLKKKATTPATQDVPENSEDILRGAQKDEASRSSVKKAANRKGEVPVEAAPMQKKEFISKFGPLLREESPFRSLFPLSSLGKVKLSAQSKRKGLL